jgi:superfamily I DNA and/or RNA helicase
MKEWFLSHLDEAVTAEWKHQLNLLQEWKKLPLTEQRKKGFAIFPLDLLSLDIQGDLTYIQFRSSFVMNDTWIKKGTMVDVHINEKTYTARVHALDAQSGTLLLLDELDEKWNASTCMISHIPDDRTFKCMEIGLRIAKENPSIEKFMEALVLPPSFITHSCQGLNDSQQAAYSAIIDSNVPAIAIQGPPGTGKSHTLSRAIQTLVAQGKKVVLTAPSNTAVNELCLKLLALQVPFLRVGNEEKIGSELQRFTIDGHLSKGNYAKTIQQLEKSLQQNEQRLQRFSRNYSANLAAEKKEARMQVKQLRAEIRTIKRETMEQLIASIPVIAGTPVGLFNHLSKTFSADCVMMDEAGQALAPLTWLVASFGKRLILCGDPQQLPPTVISNEAIKLGLGKSILEQATEKQAPLLLSEQYRMATSIVSCINDRFYNGQLQSNLTEEGICQFIDTAGYGEGEAISEETGSIYNLSEIEAVALVLEKNQLAPADTVIIAPYSAQIDALKKRLGQAWRISTIDSIQGQEAKSIIISFTRSNDDQQIGFLTDYRRTNVAISRAKSSCFLIGDSSTLGNDHFYNGLIQSFENSLSYHSIWEFIS